MNQKPGMPNNVPPMGEAVNELFARNYKTSLRVANRILRSTEDAEDAVQTAYCAAFRHIQEFRGDSSYETWITKIVVNCCLIKLRERRNRPQMALEDVLASFESPVPTPEALCYLTEIVTAHTRATSKLPKALYAVYAESLTGSAGTQVAGSLGLTTTAVKLRLLRARKKVRHALQPLMRRKAA